MDRIVNRISRRLTVLAVIVCGLAVSSPRLALAVGDIAVSPTRIVFEERDRKAQVSLINTSSTAKTYRISWTRKRLNEKGEYEDVETPLPGERFSDEMIRYSPRQITLPPGKPQLVRLLLRKPAELEAGEYRSYLRFTAVPSADDQKIDQLVVNGDQQMRISLTPIMSISIPVIVRHGQTTADVRISSLGLHENADQRRTTLSMVFERNGNRSLYGDVIAEFQPTQGASKIVGQATGVSIYPPANKRPFELPVELDRAQPGTLKVSFRARPESGRGSSEEILATAQLPVR